MASLFHFLLLLVLLPAIPAFWLGKSTEGGPVSSTIVGLFDTVRTLTKGVGGIVDQVEEGFDEIRSDEEEGEISLKLEVVLEDKNSSSSLTNSSSTTGLGGKLVIGIFDALQVQPNTFYSTFLSDICHTGSYQRRREVGWNS